MMEALGSGGSAVDLEAAKRAAKQAWLEAEKEAAEADDADLAVEAADQEASAARYSPRCTAVPSQPDSALTTLR